MSEIEIKIKLNEAMAKADKAEVKPEIKPDRDITVCLQEIVQTSDITQAHTLANEALQLVEKQTGDEYDVDKIDTSQGLKKFFDSKYGKSEDDKKKDGE